MTDTADAMSGSSVVDSCECMSRSDESDCDEQGLLETGDHARTIYLSAADTREEIDANPSRSFRRLATRMITGQKGLWCRLLVDTGCDRTMISRPFLEALRLAGSDDALNERQTVSDACRCGG